MADLEKLRKLAEVVQAAAYTTQIAEGRVLFMPRISLNTHGMVPLYDQASVLKLVAVVEAAPYAIEVIEMALHYIKAGTSDAEHANNAAAALRAALSELEEK